jgi:serine/threonine protein kinase
VFTHIAERLKDLHDCRYLHRDIKPGNIMWLPRKKRWTIIDFGCAAHTGERARTGFSLFYTAQEVIQAYKAGDRELTATEALDAWSVGILALEMFTGQPVFNLLQPKDKVSFQPQPVSLATRSLASC